MTAHESSRKSIFRLELAVAEEEKAAFAHQCGLPTEPVTAQRIPPKGGIYFLMGPTGYPRYEFRVVDSAEGHIVRTNANADHRVTADIPTIYLEPTAQTRRNVYQATIISYEI
jgi:hypothetical protein